MEKVLINESFWKGKSVFLTGHTGFKGTWATLWLSSMGAKVYGFSLDPNTTPSFFDEVCGGELCAQDTRGDIRDLKLLAGAIEKAQPEIVLHLAAQPLVRDSYEDPVGTYATNVMGTVHLLEACRHVRSVRSIVVITSDKCYDNREQIWAYRETDAMGGYDPYSSSKGAAELVVHSYLRSFFHPEKYSEHKVALASGRAGNVIGGGDWSKDRLIPDIVRAFGRKEKVVIRNPKAIRPWQHVLESLSGYFLLAQRLYQEGAKYSTAYNFGPDERDVAPVEKVVEFFSQHWPQAAGWQLESGAQPHEAMLLRVDSTKAKVQLGWNPTWELEDGLQETMDWYVEYEKNPRGIREFSLAQIQSYRKHR